MSYTGSKAQAGRGSTIGIGATPTLIGEVTDLPLTGGKWDFVDTTNLDSGNDSEMLSTVRKAPTVTIKGNRVVADAGQVAVETAWETGALSSFTVTLPKTSGQTVSGDKYVFSAYVASYDFSISPTAKIDFSMELQLSGARVFTAGS